MPRSPRSTWSITHNAADDILVLELDRRGSPAGLRLELVVFPGAGFCPSRAYWRLVLRRQDTCSLLGGQRAARA